MWRVPLSTDEHGVGSVQKPEAASSPSPTEQLVPYNPYSPDDNDPTFGEILYPSNATRNTQVLSYTDSSLMSDGWLLGPSGELLFWVPHAYRTGLWRPSNVQILGTENLLKLDLTNFVHGPLWHQCRRSY